MRHIATGLSGFAGPVPQPLWIRAVRMYLFCSTLKRTMLHLSTQSPGRHASVPWFVQPNERTLRMSLTATGQGIRLLLESPRAQPAWKSPGLPQRMRRRRPDNRATWWEPGRVFSRGRLSRLRIARHGGAAAGKAGELNFSLLVGYSNRGRHSNRAGRKRKADDRLC